MGKLIQYRPFIDQKDILRVGGRTTQGEMMFSVQHPIVLHEKHPLVRLIIKSDHWKVTPEQAPHFGGLWEAAVKSFKGHFRKIVDEVRLTFEELSTVACHIETCMNSRPLTQLPEPTDGLEVLTPGHFLIGRPLEALPEATIDELKAIHMFRQWQLSQALVSHLWKRWTGEYLSQLSRFAKWRTETPNIKEGDIV